MHIIIFTYSIHQQSQNSQESTASTIQAEEVIAADGSTNASANYMSNIESSKETNSTNRNVSINQSNQIPEEVNMNLRAHPIGVIIPVSLTQ